PLSVTKPGSGTKTYVYSDSTNCNFQSYPYVDVTQTLTPTTSRTQRGQLDQMGRLKDAKLTDPLGGDVTQTTVYGAWDQITSRTQPYRTGQQVYSTNYQYDSPSFLTIVTTPEGGGIVYAYDANLTTVTNTDQKRRRFRY